MLDPNQEALRALKNFVYLIDKHTKKRYLIQQSGRHHQLASIRLNGENITKPLDEDSKLSNALKYYGLKGLEVIDTDRLDALLYNFLPDTVDPTYSINSGRGTLLIMRSADLGTESSEFFEALTANINHIHEAIRREQVKYPGRGS